VLRQIQTNHANLRHGRLPRSWSLTTTFWHFDAVVGPSTPSELIMLPNIRVTMTRAGEHENKRERTMAVQGDSDAAVAFDLLHDIARAERKNIAGGGASGLAQVDHKWILDTYAECLWAIKNPHLRIPGQH
jgi:hypothetical protein